MTIRVEEPVESRHVGQRHLDRLVMLSDGIFAIAITLSAIELKPEQLPGESLWQAWTVPLYVYFLSFLIIGLVWMIHRRIVSHLRDVDGIGTAINLTLLSLVALMPVVIRFALTHGAQRETVQIYGLGLAITYACVAALWGYLAFIAKLAPDVSRHLARAWLYQPLSVSAFSIAVVFGAGRVWVGVAICALVGISLRWLSSRYQRLDTQKA
jgi:uncharacterized membrane protein